MSGEKKISEFQDITPAQFTADDFWIYIQSLDGSQDYRIAKNIFVSLIQIIAAPTSEKGIVAFATGGQGGAVELTKQYNRVDEVAANADSVKPSIPATVGYRQTVQNNGANDLDYFPAVGDNFLGQAVNLPITIAAGNQIGVFCYEDGVLTLI